MTDISNSLRNKFKKKSLSFRGCEHPAYIKVVPVQDFSLENVSKPETENFISFKIFQQPDINFR